MPSEYFIRKNELLTTVNNLDDSEIIMEVMNTAPANPHDTVVQGRGGVPGRNPLPRGQPHVFRWHG